MVYKITHTTEYEYDEFVSYCHNIATLRPRDLPDQKVLEYSLNISPTPDDITERTDFFGNRSTRFSIQESHKALQVTSQVKIIRDISASMDILFLESAKKITLTEALVDLKSNDPETLYARQYMLESPLIRKLAQEIRDYALISFRPDRPVFEAAYELMQRIYTDFEFVPGFTNVTTPINDVIRDRKGVCQDFAQIAIACIRSVGLPARYISGYIETIPPPGKPKLVGADASHAWFSVYIPDFGWVDLDPTNNQLPTDRHIIVAWGRDYYDVPPLKGVIYTNGENTMKVAVDIRKVG